jgi:type I restriction enzyme S subunit
MKWEKKKLGDLCLIGRGSSPRPIANPAYFDGGTIPWIKIADATNSVRYIYETKEYVNEYGASFSRRLQPGSLILAASGTLGFPMFLGVEGCIHDGWLYFDEFNQIDKDFLYYKLITLREYFNGRAYGAAIQNINTGILREVDTEIPPLPTQRRIASILSAYDDLLENNLKRIKLLEEKAFLRYKQIVKEEKMDEFLIEEVCETLGGGTPATGDRRFWDEGDILWFSPTDLTKHHSIVLLDSDKKITELGLQKSSAKLVPPKTILMTSRASIGYFGLINKPASTNQGFINIIPFNENHRAYMLFDLKNRKEEIIGNANGSTFLEISKGKFRQMKIKLPKDEKVLIDFEKEFEVIFNFIENLLKQNTKLREARDILLPRLMNGQIEV